MSRPDIIAANRLRGSSNPEELRNGIAQSVGAVICAEKRDLRHRIAQHAGSDRVPLGMVGIHEVFWGCLVDHLGQLPSQIYRILHAGIEALSARRVVGRVRRRRPSGTRLSR